MDSLQKVSSDSYFTNKKTIVTYILSVLVFWIHCSSFYNYDGYPLPMQFVVGFFRFVSTRVAVPLFFIISGALYFRNYTPGTYLRKLRSRVRTLLIPYFCWNIIMMLFQIVATLFFSRFFIGRVPFEFTLRGFLEGLLHYKYNNPFWFIFALMVFAAAAPLLDLLLSNRPLAILSTVGVWILARLGIGLPELLFHDRSCIAFYLVGGILGRYCWSWFSAPSARGRRWAAAAAIVLCWGYEYLLLFDRVPVNGWIQDPVLLVYAFAAWIAADAVCTRFRARKFMEHSFWVYALHMNISVLFTKLIWLALPKSWPMALPNFLMTTLLTLAVIEGVCAALKRYLPGIYNILCGSR